MTTEVTIKGRTYQVEPLDPCEEGSAAFRLCKADGNVYDVVRRYDGTTECTCPHYEARLKGNTRTPCKHGSALIAAGLLPPVGVDPLHVVTGTCVGCSRNVMKADLRDGDCPGCRAEREAFDPATAPEPEDDTPPDPPEPWDDFEPEPTPDDEPVIWDDYTRWELGPEPPLTAEPSPAEAPPGLTLLEWVNYQVKHYELMGTSLGWMVAGTLRKLAAEVRATEAANPAQLEERLEVLAAGHEDELARLERAEAALSKIEAAINARERR